MGDLVAVTCRFDDARSRWSDLFALERRAKSLMADVAKTYFGRCGRQVVSDELAAVAGGERMVVSGRCVYLGVPRGPQAGEGF